MSSDNASRIRSVYDCNNGEYVLTRLLSSGKLFQPLTADDIPLHNTMVGMLEEMDILIEQNLSKITSFLLSLPQGDKEE